MLCFAADENFNSAILRGLLRWNPGLDIVRVQDAGLAEEEDDVILEWAAQENRILLTHDVSTITDFAYQRVDAGKFMPGVFEVGRSVSIRTAIEDIALIAELSRDGEWEGQVRYLPLR
jgi:hypothetical protein